MKKFFIAILLIITGMFCTAEATKLKEWPSHVLSAEGKIVTVCVVATGGGGTFNVMVGDNAGNIPISFICSSEEGCVDLGQKLHTIIESGRFDTGDLRSTLTQNGWESYLVKLQGSYCYIMLPKEDE